MLRCETYQHSPSAYVSSSEYWVHELSIDFKKWGGERVPDLSCCNSAEFKLQAEIARMKEREAWAAAEEAE